MSKHLWSHTDLQMNRLAKRRAGYLRRLRTGALRIWPNDGDTEAQRAYEEGSKTLLGVLQDNWWK